MCISKTGNEAASPLVLWSSGTLGLWGEGLKDKFQGRGIREGWVVWKGCLEGCADLGLARRAQNGELGV